MRWSKELVRESSTHVASVIECKPSHGIGVCKKVRDEPQQVDAKVFPRARHGANHQLVGTSKQVQAIKVGASLLGQLDLLVCLETRVTACGPLRKTRGEGRALRRPGLCAQGPENTRHSPTILRPASSHAIPSCHPRAHAQLRRTCGACWAQSG